MRRRRFQDPVARKFLFRGMPLVWLGGLLIAQPVRSEEWARIQPPLEFEFPRDHGSHPDYRTEWWYFTGIVRDAEGGRFGFQITFFRTGLDPTPPQPQESHLRPRHILFAHLAIADIKEGRFQNSERLRRLDSLMAGASEGEMRLWLEDWEMIQTPEGRIHATASARGEGFGLDFELTPSKPVVYQGEAGYSRKGEDPGNASAYLSWTRLDTKGTLEVEGRKFEVEGGECWFDHEWGTSQLGKGVVGWDWFGLRLEDGRDLMLYRLRDEVGNATPFSSGTLIDREGAARRLRSEEFKMIPLRTWKSPASGAEYPILWRIEIPSEGLNLEVQAEISDCEMDSLGATRLVYWEGPVRVEGATQGEGYGEFTGYAGKIEGLF